MKVFYIWFKIAFACLIHFGCKKYNCQCEVIISGTITTPPQSGGSSMFTVKGPKKKAVESCQKHSSEEINGSKTECALK